MAWPIFASLAALLTGAGLLWRAWRAERSGTLAAWTGFALVLVATVTWTIADGGDRGAALALLVFTLATGTICVAQGWQAWKTAPRRRAALPKARPSRTQKGSNDPAGLVQAASTGAVLVLTGGVALAIALALYRGIDLAGGRDAVAAAFLAFPLAWSILLGIWFLSARQRRAAIAFALLGIGAGTFATVLP